MSYVSFLLENKTRRPVGHRGQHLMGGGVCQANYWPTSQRINSGLMFVYRVPHHLLTPPDQGSCSHYYQVYYFTEFNYDPPKLYHQYNYGDNF